MATLHHSDTGYFQLVTIESARALAKLEDRDRHGGRSGFLAATFTPDGTRLVAPAKEGRSRSRT